MAFEDLRMKYAPFDASMQNARSHSLIFIRLIQVCERAFALHQEQKRDHFGTVAIDVHRIFPS